MGHRSFAAFLNEKSTKLTPLTERANGRRLGAFSSSTMAHSTPPSPGYNSNREVKEISASFRISALVILEELHHSSQLEMMTSCPHNRSFQSDSGRKDNTIVQSRGRPNVFPTSGLGMTYADSQLRGLNGLLRIPLWSEPSAKLQRSRYGKQDMPIALPGSLWASGVLQLPLWSRAEFSSFAMAGTCHGNAQEIMWASILWHDSDKDGLIGHWYYEDRVLGPLGMESWPSQPVVCQFHATYCVPPSGNSFRKGQVLQLEGRYVRVTTSLHATFWCYDYLAPATLAVLIAITRTVSVLVVNMAS
ncbi:hypothetical protein L210DRAFT_3635538 [Boletus edulis BED1]|uniref:Uncharacterized protein n=1 Tax=Boletus edulis BED1 TaxID=1328754 RepID=A0AAD4BDL0_BOLED|nr:hypothetical protein L210DRAFT_3635538 [Boletus edulis BED1]